MLFYFCDILFTSVKITHELVSTFIRDQIRSLLTDGEKKTAELIEAIDGNSEAIKHELTRLVNAGHIIRVRRGVYALKTE